MNELIKTGHFVSQISTNLDLASVAEYGKFYKFSLSGKRPVPLERLQDDCSFEVTPPHQPNLGLETTKSFATVLGSITTPIHK